MKIERVDEKTVKCFLSNEELEEYEVDYKDFVMRSEKAKDLVQEIMELATEEVGYKPPKFAFDLQIMMIPDQGLVLTFSEKDPLDNMDSEDGEHLVECLKEMKRILQKNKENLEKTKEGLQKTRDDLQKSIKNAVETQAAPARPEFSVFAFRNLSRVMDYASVLPAQLRVKSSLYVMDGVYYLYLHKGAAAYEKYSRACIQALEFGLLYSAEQQGMLYLEEHGECLITEKALKKMRLK